MPSLVRWLIIATLCVFPKVLAMRISVLCLLILGSNTPAADVTQRHTFELVVFDSENSNAATYDSTTENKAVKATYLLQCDATFFQRYAIIVPNAAIQAFKVVE
jgi:hypothetical protein